GRLQFVACLRVSRGARHDQGASMRLSWFRFSALLFAWWSLLFVVFPRTTNRIAAIGVTTRHADDWTRIVGLFCLAFAFLLEAAHRSTEAALRRVVAKGVLSFTLPCAMLMTWWQLTSDRRWIRLDIADIALLLLVSY